MFDLFHPIWCKCPGLRACFQRGQRKLTNISWMQKACAVNSFFPLPDYKSFWSWTSQLFWMLKSFLWTNLVLLLTLVESILKWHKWMDGRMCTVGRWPGPSLSIWPLIPPPQLCTTCFWCKYIQVQFSSSASTDTPLLLLTGLITLRQRIGYGLLQVCLKPSPKF